MSLTKWLTDQAAKIIGRDPDYEHKTISSLFSTKSIVRRFRDQFEPNGWRVEKSLYVSRVGAFVVKIKRPKNRQICGYNSCNRTVDEHGFCSCWSHWYESRGIKL